MADETISTRIVANADFSALIADVHKVTASLSKLQEQLANSNKMLANQIAVMNRSFSDTLRSTGQFSTHFVSLQSDVEKFGRNLDGGKLKLNQYFNTFRDHARTSGGVIRDLAKQQVALQNAVLQPLGRNTQGLMQFNVHVPRGLNEIKNKTAIARQELQIMNKVIQDGAGQLINWGKNTQWAGRQLTVGLTVPLAAFGKAAADAFRQADQELVRLTKVYGDVAGTSAEELGRVRKEVTQTAKEISSAMGVSFKETIGLAADIAATGKTGDELLGSIKETTRLAVLGEVDRQDAMKATLAIQSAFKQNTDQLSESINFLNAVENQTSTSLNDLVEAIPKAGPIIQGLGGSVQDLALYLTAMREGGINASEGANALKSALASLINPTDVAVGKFKTLGIDLLGIVNNNAGNLTGTLMALQGALDTLDPLKKQQAIEQLFGKFQFSRLNALFENLGRQGSQTLQVLDLMKASSDELAAVAGRELSAVTESASGKYRRALESLKASLAEVGEQFLTINTVLIQVIDKVLQFANNLPGPVKQVMALLGGVTAVIGPFIMLTGVLANFFGYILKGIFHMKAFFKGGEGWKYLTPEMLAAEKAGKLVEQTFYSDAKAAAVLQQALRNLIDEFAVLESKAKSGAIGVSPAVSTMGGNLIMGAGGRVVNPNHPLAGAYGSRSSTHMVARSGMTEEQRLSQTMFGMVPGSGPVNQKIGQSPQIYMNDPLPNVPGLTKVNGVSTGVVAGEAARWHAMMGTLGMQSRAEIEALKKTIVATGTVNKEFMMQFDDILPIVSKLTDNAARESALIVSELRAGKLTVEAAKAKIIALNLETERMIAASVQAQATSMGRTINPTMVPTLNQPVVDPTGKSNMRELFKKGKTRDFINKIAGTLGVRTSGAGYNIETTMPRKMNSGGYVYTMNDGNIVPGPSVNADVVPAMLTPGEFVVNREATAANLPLLRSINSQSGSDLPIGYMPPNVSDSVLDIFGQRPRSRGSSSPGTLVGRWGMIMPEAINGALAQKLNSPGALGSDLIALLQQPDRLIDLEDFLSYNGVDPKDINAVKRRVAADIASKIQPNAYYADGGFGKIAISSTQSVISGLESKYPGINLKFQKDRMTPGRRDTLRRPRAGETQSQANSRGGGSPTGINYKNQRPSNYGAGATRGAQFGERQVWGHFADQEMQKNTSMLSRALGFARRTPNLMAMRNPGPSRAMSFVPGLFRNSGGIIGMNDGGMVPGYNRGGGPVTSLRMRGMWPGQASSNLNYQGGDLMPGPAPRRVMGTGMMGGLAGSIAGGSIGGAVGGSTGSLIGSIAGGFLPQMIKSVVQIISKMGVLVKSAGGVLGVVKNIGMFLKAWSIPGAVITVLGFLVKKFFDWRKEIAETKREQTNMFGLTEKGAEEAGIKYKSLTDRMKELREEQKLQRDSARAAFETYTSSGVTGLTLTIKELKDLKKQAKDTMPELLATFNSIDSSGVNDLASNLKAQMVASGKSVQEATNLIYALIEASNKAGMGVSAITSKSFKAVVDQGSAANYVVENFVKNIDKVGSIAPEAFASNLDTVISTVESAVQSLVGTKNASDETITQAEAMSIQMERLAASKLKDKQIGVEALEVLKKQRPEFAAILKSTDTIGGMIAKWRIQLSGVYVDLTKINSEQALALDAYISAQDMAQSQIASGEVTGTILDEAVTASNKLGESIKNNNTIIKNADKGSGLLSKLAIKGIQAEIKAIKERAEAKKKALRETFDSENAELELQQAKLELQSAIARGDKDAAASAQIRIQQIQKEASLKKAENNIDAIAAKEEAKQQAKLDADAAKRENQQDKAAAAGNNNQALSDTQSEIDKNIATVLKIAADKDTASKIKDPVKRQVELDLIQGRFYKFLEGLEKASNKVQEAFPDFVDSKTDKAYKKDIEIEGLGRSLPGRANQALGQLSTQVQDQSKANFDKLGKDITGGIPLSKIYEVLGGKAASTVTFKNDTEMKKVIAKNAGTESGQYKNPYGSDTYLTDAARKSIVFAKKLNAGDTFKDPNGVEYVVKNGHDANFGAGYAVRKAMGGYIRRAASGVSGMTTSQPYLVGERGPELFVPSSGGQIIPNNILGASYNIPRNPVDSVGKGANNSFNNNVYNIDIDLNGTNVTVNDIMRELDSRMALIGAKEGRVRTFGGLH